MNVKNIVDRIEAAIEPTGYSLYFGMRSMYNTVKTPKDKQVILEPFQLRPARTSLTHYDTELTMWVGLRRSISAKFTSADGANAEYMDELLGQATDILEAIGESQYFLIKQKFETISLTYYEADGGVTANSQAFIQFTIPVRIWI
jgi:hypothetical protein